MKVVAQAIVPTLRRALKATGTVPYHGMSMDKLRELGKQMFDLCNPEKLHDSQKEIVDIQTLLLHENVAIDLCFEILSESECTFYCKGPALR